MFELQSVVPAFSLGFTLISSLAAAVWFLANLREKITTAFIKADAQTRADVMQEVRRESERMEAAMNGKIGGLSAQITGLSGEFKEHQRAAATRDELENTEDRINTALRRVEDKMDTLTERTAVIGHLVETVRALNSSVESLRALIPAVVAPRRGPEA